MEIDKLTVETIKSLCLDMVENAGTGHLGMPLGSASMTYTLYKNHLNVNPKNPKWFNRDRLVYSAGHGTPLVYSMLHLFGFNVSINDIKGFRQLGSITPGHPELGITDGVDVTTGPLGQGFATAVGLAIAEKHLSEKYNKEDLKLIDHYTYVITGDGCLMEGVANEATSLAGTLGLSKLIVLYDSNDVCSDGMVCDSTNDNVKQKFEAEGWNYIKVQDGNDIEAVDKAISLAKDGEKPTIIEIKNIIGFGSKLQGTNKIHSDPVGIEELKYIKNSYKWIYEEDFFVPNEVKEAREEYIESSIKKEEKWNEIAKEYKEKYPEEYNEIFNLEENLKEIDYSEFELFTNSVATRVASGKSLNFIFDKVNSLVGGSADLGTSNKTNLDNSTFIKKDNFKGNNINFGVREFAMGCITNGITIHGGLIGYNATFLVFLDYMKSALRSAAIMKINPIYIFTHDSIIVGPDGPTHQPIEQLVSLRATPDIDVLRPVDGNETFYAWKYAVQNNKPTVLILGRQNVDIIEGTSYENLLKGGYVVSDEENYDGTIVSSGAEVQISLKAKELLAKENINVRVVNLPSWKLFDNQNIEYRKYVLDRTKPVLAVEASSSIGWHKYADEILSVDEFGESGNGQVLYEQRGFTAENIAKSFKEIKF